MVKETESKSHYLNELTAGVISAYVSKNPIAATDLPVLIGQVYAAFTKTLNGAVVKRDEPLKPAVPIKKSVTPDYIINLEDGQKHKMLKRRLATRYGMTPEQYRAKWGLPADYPMVAPNYAAQRSALAKTIGLGHKRTGSKTRTPVKRGRKKDTPT